MIGGLISGYGPRQMTYNLRRLRRKGFIQRIPRTQHSELTSEGRRLAVFFTKTLHADPQPQPCRTRPRPAPADRRPITTRQHMARVRTRDREQNQTGRSRGLKMNRLEPFNCLARGDKRTLGGGSELPTDRRPDRPQQAGGKKPRCVFTA
jgi:hypothetical protein